MERTYAVTWQEDGEGARSGKLAFAPSGLSLDGSARTGNESRLIPYTGLSGMSIAPAVERIGGRPTLILYRRFDKPLRIASVGASSIIPEVADQLTSRQIDAEPAAAQLLVVVPLKEGARKQVATLFDEGPPFDPGEIGLVRHLTFLTESEAIFLFETKRADSVERLLGEANIWDSVSAWRDLIAGPPRIAEPSYVWTRGETPETEGLFFEPTPGPGDSDGGDVYAP